MENFTTYKYVLTLPLPNHCEKESRDLTFKTFEKAVKELNHHNTFMTTEGFESLVVTEAAIKKQPVENGYANHINYSDVNPYEIVRVVSEKTIEIREMDTESGEWDAEWVSGGFAGHCVNQDKQQWKITSNEETPTTRIRWSEAKQQWQAHGMRFSLSTQPVKFYDYNF